MILTADDRSFLAELVKILLKPNAAPAEVDQALARAHTRELEAIDWFHDRKAAP